MKQWMNANRIRNKLASILICGIKHNKKIETLILEAGSVIHDVVEQDDFINPLRFSENELQELGFMEWVLNSFDGVNKRETIYLIPAWIYPFLQDGITIFDIHSNEYTTGDDLQNLQSHNGLLIYGIKK